MSVIDRLREYVLNHQRGIVHDFLFALAWVGVVSAIFGVVDGPGWAYYLLMVTGVPAYFGFVYSWQLARRQQAADPP